MDEDLNNRDYLLLRAYQAGVTDPRELAHFMGQMEVESGGFRSMHENLNYSGARLLQVFPGRNGIDTLEEANTIARGGPESIANAIYGGEWGRNGPLRNTEPGDGWAFHGRGYVQLTGRDNYERDGAELGIDLAGSPDLAADRSIAADIALRYWQTRVVTQDNQLDIRGATHDINGGEHGFAERTAATARWEQALTPEVMQHLSQRVVTLPPMPGQQFASDPSDPFIEQLQQNLNVLGITDARGQALVEDGKLGGPKSHTNEAIAAFKQQYGLESQSSISEVETAAQAAVNATRNLGIDQAIPGLPPVLRQRLHQQMASVSPKSPAPSPKPNANSPGIAPPWGGLVHAQGPEAAQAARSAQQAPMADGVLKQGERGDEVKALQGKPAALGYAGADGKPLHADGVYGKDTLAAVKQFQAINGLEDDGKAGRRTLAQVDAPNVVKAGTQPAAPSRAEPAAPASMRDPGHADNARFDQALGKLQALEQQRTQAGLKPLFANPQEAERAVGQLAYESKVSGMRQIDHVVARADGTGLFAVQGELGDPAAQRTFVDRQQAVSHSVEASSRQSEALDGQFNQRAQEQQQEQVRNRRL